MIVRLSSDLKVVGSIPVQVILCILGKDTLPLLSLSTQQYLKWVPSYRQLKDHVRVLSVFVLWARVHSYASQEVELVLDCAGLLGNIDVQRLKHYMNRRYINTQYYCMA